MRLLWSFLLLCCAPLCVGVGLGQPISITRMGETEFVLESAGPLETPVVLQESENLHLWIDIKEQASGRLSHRLSSVGTTKRYFRLMRGTSPDTPIRVALLGDSTVAGERGSGSGWGTGIYDYFKPTAQVVNLAWPNMNTRDLFTSEQMAKLLIIKPDFVLAQFGWIDWGGCNGDPRCATTLQEFAENLKTLVETIRGFNGTPILITQPDPRTFDATGNVIPALKDRAIAMKRVATDMGVHLIDLNQMSLDLVNKLGKDGLAFMSFLPTDSIHYSLEGGRVIAGMVARALPDNLGPYLTHIFNELPEP